MSLLSKILDRLEEAVEPEPTPAIGQRDDAVSRLLDKLDHVELAEMIDDEFVRQLTVMLRNHPIVVAALEECGA